ncbi:MAG: cysteine hydrolase [Lachnospiraceae bacterium]|nr:cysteine hydrolase [Lachnospiraceae bacterium]
MKTLIVVDMQNDFIDGSLGTKEAEDILPAVKEKISEYKARGDEIIYTRDTHQNNYLSTNEGKHLPVEHCIEGTAGWEIAEGIYIDGCKIINKPAFGYTGWGDFDFEEVELIGLCTDICVISNALLIKALFPEIKVSVDPECCAGVTHESHDAAITTMKMCQVDIIS